MGEQQYSYQNLYVTGLIKQGGVLVSNIDDAIAYLHTIATEFDDNVDQMYMGEVFNDVN